MRLPSNRHGSSNLSATAKKLIRIPLSVFVFKLYIEVGSVTINHFVSEYDKKPIGMVTACVKDKYCGLYGDGTYLNHRRKGVFSNLLKFEESKMRYNLNYYLLKLLILNKIQNFYKKRELKRVRLPKN